MNSKLVPKKLIDRESLFLFAGMYNSLEIVRRVDTPYEIYHLEQFIREGEIRKTGKRPITPHNLRFSVTMKIARLIDEARAAINGPCTQCGAKCSNDDGSGICMGCKIDNLIGKERIR